ncbi:MAG: dipeptidase PepE [Cyclobacteriaceae bacterium]|nr:dipeptidase PepE [Cyclobacteriaceae bacterium]
MKLLLLSNSTTKGQSYLGWPQPYLKEFLKDVSTVIFVPYAGVTISFDEYTKSVKEALGDLIVEIRGIHAVEHKSEEILKADCIMIGGGNTFSLLKKLQEENLLDVIKKAANSGTRYVGWSAGANMACPTIKTTNDMPVEQPESFNSIGLINFQINPHFTNAIIPNHGGETREMRLQEYLVKNPESKVVGLPEGMLIEIDGKSSYLKGEGAALLFRYGKENQVLSLGELEL